MKVAAFVLGLIGSIAAFIAAVIAGAVGGLGGAFLLVGGIFAFLEGRKRRELAPAKKVIQG